MNRWLKYGGIMPNWISSANFTLVEGSQYTIQGEIAENNFYQRTTNFYTFYPGKYNIKLIVNSITSATGSRLRIIAYDMEENFKDVVDNPITFPLNKVDTILSYQFEIKEIVKVRFSYRTLLTLLGIEKL